MAKAKTSPDKDAPVPAPAPPEGAGAASAAQPGASTSGASTHGASTLVASANIPLVLVTGEHGTGRVERGDTFEVEDAKRAAHLVKAGFAHKP